MHQVVQTIRDIARHEMDQQWSACMGVVKSVQGAGRYSCTVVLRESGLVLPEVPIATSLMGIAALPAENDLVLVMFAGGDPHAPVVIGRLYSDKVKPPKNDSGELVIALPGGEDDSKKLLELRVTTPGDGTRKIDLVLDGDVKIGVTIDDEGIAIKAQDTMLTLKQTSSSDGKAELTVGDNKIILEQGGDITVEATGKLTLKASKIEISGDTEVKIAGQKVELN